MKTKADDETYEAKFMTLKENVTHHIQEEEGKMFPEMQSKLGNMDELGRRMMERKEELMRDPMKEWKKKTSGSRSRSSSTASRSRSTSRAKTGSSRSRR